MEFAVGLFAQHHDDATVLPETLNAMVAVDAFSQILTNPCWPRTCMGRRAFGEEGLAEIDGTASFQQLVARNGAPGAEGVVFASFDLR